MKTKTKKRLKHLAHKATHKKLVKKRTSQKLMRTALTLVLVACTGSLAFAITQTRPTVQIDVEASLKPRSLNRDPVFTGPDQSGIASWYALGLPAPDAHTCASTKYRRGTYLSVKNLRNGKTVVCLVNDYGPEAWTKRAVDLSRGSFRAIEDLSRGTTPVEIRVVPSAPTGHNFDWPRSLSAFWGYRLCLQKHDASFCEQNRQRTIQLD